MRISKFEVLSDEKYDKEFKLQTVQMILEEGKSVTQVALELVISDNILVFNPTNQTRYINCIGFFLLSSNVNRIRTSFYS